MLDVATLPGPIHRRMLVQRGVTASVGSYLHLVRGSLDVDLMRDGKRVCGLRFEMGESAARSGASGAGTDAHAAAAAPLVARSSSVAATSQLYFKREARPRVAAARSPVLLDHLARACV